MPQRLLNDFLQSFGILLLGLVCHLPMMMAGEEGLGIGSRVPWTTSRIRGTPEPPLPYSSERIFPQLKFDKPTVLTNAPGTDRLFLAELGGMIYSFPNRPDVGQLDLLVDLNQSISGEPRVYGLTFHPHFSRNRYCYVCYVVSGPNEGTYVSRFKVSTSDPPQLEMDTEIVILTWPAGGHNGGCLKFGPDGYLYVTTGDSAAPSPPDSKIAGQDLSNLLASILRVDVDRSENDRAYAIPKDNPFIGLSGARGEVWCYGLRNPWKISFDILTGDLWVGDVGWDLWEMIYRVERGGNYGWSLMEGPQPIRPERKQGPTPVLPPTVVHSHTESRSITGGFVYRGSRLSELVGSYIYGDFVTGKIWGAVYDAKRPASVVELANTPLKVICFGVDNKNELMVVDYGGTIHRLVMNTASAGNREFPDTLSDTGLFQDVADHRVFPGVISYSINAEPWADHTTADRYLALPGTTQLEMDLPNDMENGGAKVPWRFPDDSILLKTVSLEIELGNPNSRRRLETQVLHRNDGQWRAYSYVWNDEQTDGFLAEDAAQQQTFLVMDPGVPGGIRKQTYHFASRSECLLCHTAQDGAVNGLFRGQLNRLHQFGEIEANQLAIWSELGLFAGQLPKDLPQWPSPTDSAASLEERARVYLHVNCAPCHRPRGGGLAAMDLRYAVPLERSGLLDSRPSQGTFGMPEAGMLVPGDPYRSLLFYRMAATGRARMPKMGSSVIDEQGMLLIENWIANQEQVPLEGSVRTAIACQRAEQRKQLAILQAESSSSTEQQTAIEKLLNDTSGGLLLASSLTQDQLTAGTRQQLLEQVVAVSQNEVRELFQQWLPEDQQLERLGAVVDTERVLAVQGDVQRGRHLFGKGDLAQCKNCHQVGEVGQAVGPDLKVISKKSNRSQLLESILEPSKVIEPKYVTYLVETKGGVLHTGLLVVKNGEELLLKNSQGKMIRLPADQIESMLPQEKSLMPEMLLRDMTVQQVADLLAFLESLK